MLLLHLKDPKHWRAQARYHSAVIPGLLTHLLGRFLRGRITGAVQTPGLIPSGYLHLIAAYNTTTGHWECAEVYTTQSLVYGTYQWQVEGNLGSFDKNIVLGMYNYTGNDGHDEMDIEIARWGNAAWDNLNYTIWSATGVTASPGVYTASFTTPSGTYTTHSFKRTSTSVNLQSLYGFQNGDTNQFQTATFTSPGTSISTLAMPVHMNLWLFSGLAPSDGQNVEVIIHSFKFTAL